MDAKPAIAQLVEHLTVEFCSNQMVPGSIPGGRIFLASCDARLYTLDACMHFISNHHGPCSWHGSFSVQSWPRRFRLAACTVIHD